MDNIIDTIMALVKGDTTDEQILDVFNSVNKNWYPGLGASPDRDIEDRSKGGALNAATKAVLKKHGINRTFEDVDSTHTSYTNERGQRVVVELPKWQLKKNAEKN